MKKRTSRQPMTMIRWTFQYGRDLVHCEVLWQPATSHYVVSVAPNGIEEAAMTEPAASSVAALRRHAEIAAALRARGWTLVGYSDAHAAGDRRRALAA